MNCNFAEKYANSTRKSAEKYATRPSKSAEKYANPLDFVKRLFHNNLMLKRRIEQILLDWKNKKTSKNCLLVKGARQVGKTFIIEKFGQKNYESFIHINFEKTPTMKDIFAGNLDIETLRKQITLNIPTAKLLDRKTLIFLDEIQSCPNARTSLKFFAEDGRYDVIASGSLLGVNYREVSSYPTGYEDEIEMHSLDFEEFLWANGVSDASINDIKQYMEKVEPVPTAMHNKMMNFLREYIVIGGMPAVVNEFVKSGDFNEALRIQRSIINNYMNDIAKYAPAADKAKAKACFLSVPRQLAKENKKFQYTLVEKKSTARKYEGSLMWLHDAGIICFCNNLTQPETPLEGNVKDGFFKVYMKDCGLLVAMLEDGTQKDIIDGNLGIYKGAIYENLIGSIFTHNNKRLYYYAVADRFEVDFVIRYGGKATGVEVKSGNTKAISLQLAMSESPGLRGIKLATGNVGETGNIKTFPLYMAMFL